MREESLDRKRRTHSRLRSSRRRSSAEIVSPRSPWAPAASPSHNARASRYSALHQLQRPTRSGGGTLAHRACAWTEKAPGGSAEHHPGVLRVRVTTGRAFTISPGREPITKAGRILGWIVHDFLADAGLDVLRGGMLTAAGWRVHGFTPLRFRRSTRRPATDRRTVRTGADSQRSRSCPDGRPVATFTA